MGLTPQTSPTIRKRRRRRLVRFDLTAPIDELCTPQHALFDKIQLQLSAPIRFTSRQSIDEYVSLIADNSGVDIPLFKSSPSETQNSVRFSFSEGWHFSGTARLTFNDHFRGHFQLVLSINPTRWLDQLEHFNLQQLSNLQLGTVLRRNPDISSNALDGNDNLLRGFYSVGDPLSDPRVDQFMQFIAAYRIALERLLNERLVPSPLGVIPHDVTIGEIVLPSPSYVECYHEFFSDDAVSVVEGLRTASRASFVNVSWQTHRIRRIGGMQRRNSNSVVIPLTKDCSVSIYAKTSQRIRIEVRFSGRLPHFAFPSDLPRPQRTFERLLSGLRIEATNRIKRLLQSLTPQAHVVDQRMEMLDLLDAVYRALEHDLARARALFSVLINSGGATETDANGILPPSALRFLLQRGVLEHRPVTHGNAFRGQRRYALTAIYAATAARFVDAD